MEYQKYLNTAHWQNTKKRLIKQKGRICKICESNKKIHIHHKTYKDNLNQSILFKERNHNLIPLCSSCHSTWHSTHKYLEIRPMDYVRAKLLLKLGATRKQAIKLCVDRRLGIEWLRQKINSKILFPHWGILPFN